MTLPEAKTFIEVWFSSSTTDEVCERLNLDKRRASNTAAMFRRRGIELPLLPARANRPYEHILNQKESAELRQYAAELAETRRRRLLSEEALRQINEVRRRDKVNRMGA